MGEGIALEREFGINASISPGDEGEEECDSLRRFKLLYYAMEKNTSSGFGVKVHIA